MVRFLQGKVKFSKHQFELMLEKEGLRDSGTIELHENL